MMKKRSDQLTPGDIILSGKSVLGSDIVEAGLLISVTWADDARFNNARRLIIVTTSSTIRDFIALDPDDFEVLT